MKPPVRIFGYAHRMWDENNVGIGKSRLYWNQNQHLKLSELFPVFEQKSNSKLVFFHHLKKPPNLPYFTINFLSFNPLYGHFILQFLWEVV